MSGYFSDTNKQKKKTQNTFALDSANPMECPE